MRSVLLPLALVASAFAACADPIGSFPGSRAGSGGEPGTETPGGPTDEFSALAAAVKPGPAMLRNVSNREYLATVSDLVGEELSPELQKSWTATTQFSGFDAVPWTNLDAKAIRDREESVQLMLDKITASPKVMTCMANAAEQLPYDRCAKGVVERFAARAFGRPLTEAERTTLAATYTDGAQIAKATFPQPSDVYVEGIRAALGSVLLSPQMLTRAETPPAPDFAGDRDLNPYELANRLSYMFLGSAPDDELWQKAEDGSLVADGAAVQAQVDRFMTSKLDAFVASFMGQWLDFRAMEAAAPGSIEAAMWKESVLTLSEIVRSDMPLSSIVSPGFTFVNKQLAEHYGLPADGLGEDFKRVEMPSRGGVLQQGSWLTLSASSLKTSPMHRGRLVQDRLLCKVIPPPDSTLFEQIQQVANSIPADATVKQRVDQHRQAGPQCFGCHQFMDPIGLSLEGFDQFGKVRKTYSDGRAVETNSELLGTPVASVEDINRIILGLPDYNRCASEKLAIFGLRRVIDQHLVDKALVDYLVYRDGGQEPSVRELVRRLVSSAAFRKVSHGVKN